MYCLLPDKLTMKKVKIEKRRIIVAVEQHELAQVKAETLDKLYDHIFKTSLSRAYLLQIVHLNDPT